MNKVSIIVPVYSVEAYIDKCINSILSQTYEDWELILVDDGSPDMSGIICDKYAGMDRRIRVIHKNNEGVSIARNTGLDDAKGGYICFIDSDDWVEPTYIESLMRYSENDECIVYGNVINDFSDGRKSIPSFNYVDGLVVSLDNNEVDIVNYRIPENGYPVAKLYRKSIIDYHNLRFDEQLSYHEDHLFVLDYLSHVKHVLLSSKADYHYMHREGNNSLSKKKHATCKLIDASSKLIAAITNGIERWQITDTSYLKRLYTYLGLNQLMIALSGASSSELPIVAKSIRDNIKLFRLYYCPNHKEYKIVPLFIQLRFDLLYKFLLLWKERHT